jgi:hypothetical protein
MRRWTSTAIIGIIALSAGCAKAPRIEATRDAAAGREAVPPSVKLQRDDKAGQLRVLIGGKEAFVYQYAEALDLPHYWPMRSPEGKNMLVQMTEPYPHHRSFWFADTVKLDGGRDASLYNAYYSGREVEPKVKYAPPFKDRIRHAEFTRLEAKGARAVVDARLLWEMDGRTPILDERRTLVVHALGEGEYLLDLAFVLTAVGNEVAFVSDDVHYAWPYLRLEKRWSGENGGKITNDAGAEGEKATNMTFAKWVDYSNAVEGESAGAAVFQYPDWANHRWLTREYGCFGPRRPDGVSGRPFVLKKSGAIKQRVGVLVHKGDAKTGRVAERYDAYIKDRWR